MSDSGLRLPSDRVRDEARRAIEALVLVAEDPLDTNLIGQLLELSPPVVDELCRGLAEEYETQGRGFQLVRVAGGWRYQTHPDQAPYVERFVLEGQTAKLSAAALETLAIVAYKQPISRAQVASIRGVSADGVMRTLTQRGYIAELGRDTGPGQAVLYGTTRSFLEQLGLDDLSQLPPLGDFVPSAAVVEQLEQGLRPEGMASPDRYDATAATEAFIGGGDRAEHGDGEFDGDLDAELGADLEDVPASRDGLDGDAGDGAGAGAGSGDGVGAGEGDGPSGGNGNGFGTRSPGDGDGSAERGGWPGDRSRP